MLEVFFIGIVILGVYGTYENNVRAREKDAGITLVRRVTEGDDRVCEGCDAASSDEYVAMDEIADIGTQECNSRDRCFFEFSYAGVEGLTAE